MAFPEPIPILPESDFDQVLREIEEYKMSEEQRCHVQMHEAAIDTESD